MDENKPLEKLEEALNKNELLDYLLGKEDYYFPNKWIETPTDLDAIFLRGFNNYIKKNEKSLDHLNRELNKALLLLLNDPIGTGGCISIINNYYFGFIDNALLFEIKVEDLISKLNKSIQVHKEKLINNKNYVGKRFDKGLWENLSNMVEKINNEIEKRNLKIELN